MLFSMISQKEIFLSRGYDVPNFYYDADGRQVEIETREDEEQSLQLDRIIKSLVKAGYYRAKIKGISPFDIVVGGMTWCIDSSDIDLDVDLLFEEGLSIGQKIALTEKIVVVLPKIKCPHNIEPHEIQGLNFIHIYPVINWLISWSRENRERQAVYLREYARNQYHKNFTNENADAFREAKKSASEYTQLVREKYQPRRLAKQTDSKSVKDIKLKVLSTLAEYGIPLLSQNKKYCLNNSLELKVNKEQQKSISQNLSSQLFTEEKLNFEDVFYLVSSDYHAFDARKKLNKLKKELNDLKEKEEKLIPVLQEAQLEESELSSKLEEKTIEIQSLTEEEQKTVQKIQEFIKIHEAVREEEKGKKESFKQEVTDLQFAISELENSSTNEEIELLQKQVGKLQKLLEVKKLALAEIARNVTSVERKLERIPTRAELSQYQKRYLELYRIHTLKTAEAKHNIMTYNMLDNRKKFIIKQNNILNSFQDSYTKVMTSAGYGQDHFFQQMEVIIGGIVKAKQTISASKARTEEIQKQMSSELRKIQNQKTEYAKAVNTLNTLYKRQQTFMDLYNRLKVSLDSIKASVMFDQESTSDEISEETTAGCSTTMLNTSSSGQDRTSSNRKQPSESTLHASQEAAASVSLSDADNSRLNSNLLNAPYAIKSVSTSSQDQNTAAKTSNEVSGSDEQSIPVENVEIIVSGSLSEQEFVLDEITDQQSDSAALNEHQ